jgi:deazaflavin-dependent oxidoreductase (nitroreductase family)
MNGSAIPFRKPGLPARRLNRAVGLLAGLGIGCEEISLVEVQGRKSGKLYCTPVTLLTQGGKQYLVAPRGRTQWVRNAEVAGKVRLRKGRQGQEFRLRSLSAAERPPILKLFLDRFHRRVQWFFPVPAGSPVEMFASLAHRDPVFEVLTDTEGQ